MKLFHINNISKFVTGGTMNDNTTVNITDNGNTVTYDYSQNEDINNPGYLGNETYDLGVLPSVEVKASTNSARSNKAYRNYLLRHQQNEFNNYITEGTNKFARPIQETFLSAVATPIANPIIGKIGSFIGGKIPAATAKYGKHIYNAANNIYSGVSTVDSFLN